MIKLIFEGTAQEVQDEMRAFVGAAKQTAKAKPATAAQPSPTPAVPTAPAKTYTLDELLAAAGPLMDAGKGPELQELMKKYAVASMMDLPKERYGELATDLRALGARL